MTVRCTWPLGGLRHRAVCPGSPGTGLVPQHTNVEALKGQLRYSGWSLKPAPRSKALVCEGSATALDADVTLGQLSPTGPVGQLGFSTAMQQDFYSARGRHLGKGAYGVVSTVVDRRTGHEYACKALPKTRGSLSPARTAKKIWAEVNTLSRLSKSDNIAKLHAVYEDATHVYLIQELCQGGDLEALIMEQGPFSERQAALVLYECLRVIAACHDLNVVHGDVKPANFLLDQRIRNPMPLIEAGTVTNWLKAIDFGCSQEVRGPRFSRRTGTPVYMAPEVFQRDYDQAADMWSLGMMLYQFLTCRLPFWSSLRACREQSLDDVAKSVCRSQIPLDLAPFRQMSPEGLDLLQSLLERDPVKRATATEALAHPWFARMKKRAPGVLCSNNVVPLRKDLHQGTAPRSGRQQSVRRQQQQCPKPIVRAPPVQQSVMRVGRSYPSPSAVGSLAY